MRSPIFSGQGSNAVPALGKAIDCAAIFPASETKNSTFTITPPVKKMNYDTLIDRKSWPANQYLSDDTLDHVQSILAADFIDWLDSSPITQRQIVCWMAAQDIAGWLPVSRIYRDFNKSSRNLTDYLRKNRDNCIALARWVKHCSDARWTGVDGLYDQFVEWVAQ